MSVLTLASRFMTLRPAVRMEHDRLVVRTGWPARLLTLGLRSRRVEIEPARRRLTIRHRTGYLFGRTTELDFDDVWYLDYAYASVGTSWGWSLDGVGRTDEVERFAVAVVTEDGQSHTICSFFGEGSVHTGWAGTIFGDGLVDVSGTQDSESRQFAVGLAYILGVPIGKPLPAEVEAELLACAGCGHNISPHAAKCLYCGAAQESATAGD